MTHHIPYATVNTTTIKTSVTSNGNIGGDIHWVGGIFVVDDDIAVQVLLRLRHVCTYKSMHVFCERVLRSVFEKKRIYS